MAYSDKVLEHYEKPHNVGSLDSGSNRVGTGLVGAPECGDVMKLQMQVGINKLVADAGHRKLDPLLLEAILGGVERVVRSVVLKPVGKDPIAHATDLMMQLYSPALKSL